MKTKIIYFIIGAFVCLACVTSSTFIQAQISNSKLAKLRRNITGAISDSVGVHVGYTKLQINAVLDSLESRYVSEWRSEFSSEVTSSGTIEGLTFTGLQKKLIFAFWMENKIDEELGR